MEIKPPDGYDSWLEYAIRTMDTRSEYLLRIDSQGADAPTREDMLNAAKAEHANLRRDSERLEWLFSHDVEICNFGGGWQYGHMEYEDFICDHSDHSLFYPTFRKAIDAAMQEDKQNEPEKEQA